VTEYLGSADTALSSAALAERYGLTVSGRRPPLAEYTRRLWGRRHFIVAFATARLTATYTAARLGQVWQVMTPLLNAAVYYLIFGLLLGTKHDIPNFIAYLCTGVFVFQFTQSAVLSGTRSIADNLGLIRALHFPRACLPIAFTVIQLQQLLFSKIVPNCKKLGLLDAGDGWLRQKFVELEPGHPEAGRLGPGEVLATSHTESAAA